MTTIFEGLESVADEFAAFGQADVANAVRETVRRAEECRADFWNETLDVDDAVSWSGYTSGHLRKMVKGGTIIPGEDGRIRRRDLPVKPGHPLPLELGDDMERASWHERLRRNRDVA